MSISGQIVPEIVAQLCLENSLQTLLNFLGVAILIARARKKSYHLVFRFDKERFFCFEEIDFNSECAI